MAHSQHSQLRRISRATLWLACLSGVACTGTIGGSGDRTISGETGKPGDPGSTSRDPAARTPDGTGTTPGQTARPALGEAALRRLTTEQYRNALTDLLGLSATEVSAAKLEDDARLSGLTAIGATVTSLSTRATELFEQAADEIATRLFADAARRTAMVGCDPAQAPCLEGFVSRFGRRAWRRVLSAAEVRRYVTLAQLAATKTTDAWAGVRTSVVGLLQSPNFLYRTELGRADAAEPSRRALDPYELASRLSFFLTNRAPDDQLLDAAERDQLRRPEDLAAQAQRLLASPRAVAAVESFYEDYLDLGSLNALTKDAAAFPAFNDALKTAMRLETVRTLRTLTFDESTDFRKIFDARTTFVTPELARLYGLPAPAATEPTRTEYASTDVRAGILMHASLLALNAHEAITSPSRRGKFVRETILCQSIPDPPENVETNLPPTSAMLDTTRKRLEAHVKDPACAGCHELMDPIGLAMENFDAIGRFRANEKGVAIDASGTLDGVAFSGPLGLAQALANHAGVPGCFTTTLLRQAAGEVLALPAEQALVSELESQFRDAKFSVRALLQALVAHPAFRYVRPSQGG